MEEIWKDIEGYEGKYEISNTGRVKSYYGPRGDHRIAYLKPRIGKQGYYFVNLTKNKKIKSKKIHRLIAEAFIPNPFNKAEVNHINGIKTDNNIDNLEWTTRQENAAHALKHGLFQNCIINKHGKEHPTTKPVKQYSLDGCFIKEWESAADASRALNINRNYIYSAIVGKDRRRTAGGYIWKY